MVVLDLVLALSSSAPAREVRLVMGTMAEVRVAGLTEPGPPLDAAFAALERVDERLSLFRDSELARLNRAGEARASPELLAVLRHALEVAAASNGAFDPTVEPLVRASGGFGGRPRRPGPQERRRLLARVGAGRVRLDEATGTVQLEAGTSLDLGGIAKGYAVDLALAALRSAGARSALVDVGGSSLGGFGDPLAVWVRDPLRAGAPPWAAFEVRDAAVGSSGGDQRAGHIVDPRTGIPSRGVLAATVVARTAMEADALSTAVYVLGAEEGLALLVRRGAAGLVLLREGRRNVIRTTPDFASRYALRSAPDLRVVP